MQDTSPEEHTTAPKKHRRTWSIDEKKTILSEAEALGISATAKKHRIAANVLFCWRKEIYGTKNKFTPIEMTQENCYRETLTKINKLGSQVEQIGDKLFADLNAGKVPSYNGAIAYAGLTNAFGKLRAFMHDTNDKLKAATALDGKEVKEEDLYDLEMRRVAEQCVLRLVKDHILPEQRANAAKNAAQY